MEKAGQYAGEPLSQGSGPAGFLLKEGEHLVGMRQRSQYLRQFPHQGCGQRGHGQMAHRSPGRARRWQAQFPQVAGPVGESDPRHLGEVMVLAGNPVDGHRRPPGGVRSMACQQDGGDGFMNRIEGAGEEARLLARGDGPGLALAQRVQVGQGRRTGAYPPVVRDEGGGDAPEAPGRLPDYRFGAAGPASAPPPPPAEQRLLPFGEALRQRRVVTEKGRHRLETGHVIVVCPRSLPGPGHGTWFEPDGDGPSPPGSARPVPHYKAGPAKDAPPPMAAGNWYHSTNYTFHATRM